MATLALRLYHQLPPPMRSVAATLRGLTLRRWRYGAETEQLIAETIERESWSPARWDAWRGDRLARLLHRAATRVPYYRALWSERRRRGDRRSWEQLEHWPILEKATLRQQARNFVADDCNTSQMFHEHTSGTSGTALDLWWSRRTVRGWYALFEARCRLWSGVSRHDRWAMLGGQMIAPVAQSRPPFWVWNGALNQLYMSTYHLSPEAMPSYLDALSAYRVSYLWGYSSSLFELARFALRSGDHRLPPLVAAITNAEPLLETQRVTIARAFGCPVRETYGMAEIVTAASECVAGRLHAWPEVGVTEVLDGDTAVPAGQPGDLIATGLLNPDMPLIRYRVGDRLALAPRSDVPCACGRSLPTVSSIEGRTDDVVITRDGRRIGRLDPVFKAGLPIAEAQIVQESLDRLRIRFVPDPAFSSDGERALRAAVHERVGDMQLVLERVPRIERSANGKFRAVINCMPATERGR